jgi:cephalosporin hydroxylase
MLNWTADKTFVLDDITFTLDITPGYNRRASEKSNFTLVKTRSYLKDYLALGDDKFDNILELGIFQGGSIVFFDKLFRPKKLIGIELAPTAVEALDDYIRSSAPHIKVFYNSSQDDERLLNAIVHEELNGQLDLVVDDASHLYTQTRKSMEVLFPLLRPGGTYIIEDWAWSHRPNAQTKDHPWRKQPAMTNLIFEIITELGGSNEIESVYVNSNHVRIEKSLQSKSVPVLDSLALRGSEIKLI